MNYNRMADTLQDKLVVNTKELDQISAEIDSVEAK